MSETRWQRVGDALATRWRHAKQVRIGLGSLAMARDRGAGAEEARAGRGLEEAGKQQRMALEVLGLNLLHTLK